MVELPKSRYDVAQAQYKVEQIRFPLMYAVLGKQQEGGIYANSFEEPSSFFVYNRFGFCQFFGENRNVDFNRTLHSLIFTDSGFPVKYLLWYNPETKWHQFAQESALKESYKLRMRTQFRLNSERFKRINQERPKPGRLELKTINSQTGLQEAGVFQLDLSNRFWNSAQDFLQHGLAILGYWDEQPVTICYSATTAARLAEVDVATLEGYRGKGLATFVTLAFNELSLRNGLTPNWDCFDENKASYHLALTTGFEAIHQYPFLSIYREFTN